VLRDQGSETEVDRVLGLAGQGDVGRGVCGDTERSLVAPAAEEPAPQAPAAGIELEVHGDVRLDANGAATVNALCHSGADSDTTFADRDIVACNPGTLTDYAEYYPTDNDVAFGDLVMLGTTQVAVNAGDGFGNPDPTRTFTVTKLTKTTSPYTPSLMGIVSRNFGDFTALGEGTIDSNHHPLPIALNGRVPAKVSTENGPINSGDPITSSSQPGVGMKATRTGRIIGIALEAFPASPNDQIPSSNDQNDLGTLDFDIGHSSQGEVMVFVNPSWYVSENPSSIIAPVSSFTLTDALSHLGATVKDGITAFAELVVDKLQVTRSFTVGESKHPVGITLYDEDTGEPYCVKIKRGELISVSGACPQ